LYDAYKLFGMKIYHDKRSLWHSLTKIRDLEKRPSRLLFRLVSW